MTDKNPLVLVDRDGTIIEDVPYLSRLSDVRFLPGVIDAIRTLNRRNIPVAVVTNQSGVARGLFSESFVRETHEYMNKWLGKERAAIDSFLYCPHFPEAKLPEYRHVCLCRKPEPGLLLDAMKQFGARPESTIMVGDMLRDMIAAQKAGVKGFMIQGENEDNRSEAGLPYVRVSSFSEAVDRFLDTLSK
jgi:D-glycero-D-manno-heptose 1,7-bisphosphate phosphatase